MHLIKTIRTSEEPRKMRQKFKSSQCRLGVKCIITTRPNQSGGEGELAQQAPYLTPLLPSSLRPTGSSGITQPRLLLASLFSAS